MFNHSCYPNLCLITFRNLQIGVAIRPVEKNEQLFITYRPLLENYTNTPKERQEFLQKHFGFKCECSKCLPQILPIIRMEMKMDLNYEFVHNFFMQNYSSLISSEECAILKANCFEFLRKFGNSPWTEEIEIALMCYVHCIDQEYQERWVNRVKN